LNLELFIAKRLVTGKESKGFVSRRLVNITTIGISLGLAVMLISVSIVTGFKKQITDKVIGFGGQIQVEYMDDNASYETKPISRNQAFLTQLKKNQNIKHIQAFGLKAGIMKTPDEFQGIVIKGVDKNYDWSFFKKILVEGKLPRINDSVTNEIIISKDLANKLRLKAGDDVALYFIQEPVRVRRMHISGLYQSGLGELDNIYAIGNLLQVQQLNNWTKDQISGFEISVKDFSKLENITDEVYQEVSLTVQPDGSSLRTTNIKEKYIQIFDWINLQNVNVAIIIILMLMVAGFNMISGLLILILERTRMIGLLISLGARSARIRKIFIYQSGFLMLRGLFWGNLIGLSLLFLQYQFKWIKLDEASYYINSVPVNFDFLQILIINAGSLLAILVMLIFPSMIISKISPDVTLKYD
jgi:lipoprotein-releasing system permease protein